MHLGLKSWKQRRRFKSVLLGLQGVLLIGGLCPPIRKVKIVHWFVIANHWGKKVLLSHPSSMSKLAPNILNIPA
jgi:hypothetical protein